MAGKRLVIGGAGHVNIGLLSRSYELSREGHDVVVVNPDPFQYYSGMGPGMLGGTYQVDEIRFPVAAIAARVGARFVQDRIVRVDPHGHELVLAGGDRLPFDVLSLNTGSHTALPFSRPPDGSGLRLYTSKPIKGLVELRQELEARRSGEPVRVVVAGGGPAAVELAANIAQLLGFRRQASVQPHHVVTMVTGSTVLPGFPRRASRAAARALEQLGVRLRIGDRVRELTSSAAICDSGAVGADMVVAATGVVPSPLMRASGLPVGDDMGLTVGESLNVMGLSHIFGGGDCIFFSPQPLAKVGVYAVRQTPVIVSNVIAAMRGGGETRPFRPQRNYLLLINLGDGRALLWRRVLWFHVVWTGRWVWRLKDRIDRAFMAEYGSDREWHQEPNTY